jgi:hypothetical protein
VKHDPAGMLKTPSNGTHPKRKGEKTTFFSRGINVVREKAMFVSLCRTPALRSHTQEMVGNFVFVPANFPSLSAAGTNSGALFLKISSRKLVQAEGSRSASPCVDMQAGFPRGFGDVHKEALGVNHTQSLPVNTPKASSSKASPMFSYDIVKDDQAAILTPPTTPLQPSALNENAAGVQHTTHIVPRIVDDRNFQPRSGYSKERGDTSRWEP